MQVNAPDLLRKTLEGSNSHVRGYKVTLERPRVHLMQIQGDALVVDVDEDLTVR